MIGINVLGSCYGSTGPRSINPTTGKPYGADFPVVSIRDMVRAQAELIQHLGIHQLRAVLGGSIGGMQALQWTIDFPERVAGCFSVGAAPLSAMGLALNHLQREIIRLDPAWNGGDYTASNPPTRGLALARGLAVCTYKSSALFNERFGRKPDRSGEDPLQSHAARYDAAGYLDYQGRIFNERFDANSYLVISRAMDTFDLARGYASEEEALRRIRARLLVVGISSDWLFPAADVHALAERIQNANAVCNYIELHGDHGHDAFLAEVSNVRPLIEYIVRKWRSPRPGKNLRPLPGLAISPRIASATILLSVTSMIETARLRLRPWQPSDLPAFAAMNADPLVRRHFSSLLTREESDASVDRFIRMKQLDGYGFMATELRENSEFIGLLGIQRMSFLLPGTTDPAIEIGWRFNEKSWGKGLATEGAQACLQLAFEQFQIPEIVAFTIPANLPSRRVMEKLGMTRNPDDDFDDPRIPAGNLCQRHVLYRIQKSDWQRGS